ncbi:MAG: hypothetical protein RLN60_04190 [Phycisphaerales bacterium]
MNAIEKLMRREAKPGSTLEFILEERDRKRSLFREVPLLWIALALWAAYAWRVLHQL